jgi:uncharacterized protein YndB with AHSA1/START domain
MIAGRAREGGLMDRRLSIWAGMALAALAGAAVAAAPPPGWSPGPAAASDLAHGQAWAEVLPGPDGTGVIHAAVDIPAPAKTVWRVMTDCAFAQRLVVTVTSCRVLHADPSGAWDVREQVTKGNFIVPEIHNIFRSDYQPYARIAFRKAGGDLRAENGEWRLEPIDGGAGTRVIYVNQIGADIMAPAALVREGMRRDTPKVLMNLKRECLARR